MPKSAFNKDGAIKEKRLLVQEFCYSATVIFLIVQIFPNIHQIYISVDTIFFVLKVLLFYLRGAFSILSARKFEVLLFEMCYCGTNGSKRQRCFYSSSASVQDLRVLSNFERLTNLEM